MKPSLATLQRIKACTLNVVVLILIATLCCILFGCRSSRSSTKVDYQRTQQGTTTTTTTTDVWKFLNSVRTENELTDEETEWTIFDTSCTDSTGAHPVLAKGSTKKKKQSQATTTTAVADSLKQNTTTQQEENEAETLTIATESEVEATPIFKQTYRFIIVLCAMMIIIACLVIWIRKKILKL